MNAPLNLSPMRPPPANLAAEQGLLGALLANNKVFDRIASTGLEPRHFADPAHGVIFEAIARRIEAGQVVDAVSARAELDQHPALAEAGGGRYLATLLGAMVSTLHAPVYAGEVRDAWTRREILRLCEDAATRCHAPSEGGEGAAILSELDAGLMALSRDGSGSRELRESADVAAEVMGSVMAALQRRGGLSGVTWGYEGLDRMTGGMRGGQLIVCGARPSMGKTALSVAIAARAAAAGARVLYVSAEMAAREVMARVTAAIAGLPVNAVTRGGMEDEDGRFRQLDPEGRELRAIGDAARRASLLPILWDDAPQAMLPMVRAKARQAKRQGGLDLVVVDYLGRVTASERARSQNRVAEVSELTAGFKSLAMELDVPVLLLSQLSRGVEGREDKMPTLSDLRDSGTIEQDADVVTFLYREHYYLSRSKPVRGPKETAEQLEQRTSQWFLDCERAAGKATVLIAKQRQGPIGPVRLRFEDRLTWFFNEYPDGGHEPAVPGLPT